MDNALLKNRSYRGVIAAGFGLYLSHFRLFFKASWLMALLFAVVFAAVQMLLAVELPALMATIIKVTMVDRAPLTVALAQQYLMTMGTIIILSLVLFIVESMTYGTVLNKLKEHQDTGALMEPRGWFYVSGKLMWRTIKSLIFSVLVVLVPFLIITGFVVILAKFVGVAPYTLVVTAIVAVLVLLLLCLPLYYVMMKYVLTTGKRYFSLLPGAFATGMRHWGKIFTVMLIVSLVVGILMSVCGLPAFILSQAHYASQEGFLNGDALGMPDYITTLSVVTYFLTGFVMIYLCMPLLTTCYYLYGSIECYEALKTKEYYTEQN